MKKITLLTLVFFGFFSTCLGQELQTFQDEPRIQVQEEELGQDSNDSLRMKKVAFGIIGGYNYAWMNQMYQGRGRDGFYVGMMIETKTEEDNLSIQFELLYTQMGMKRKEEATFLRPMQREQINIDQLVLNMIINYHLDRFVPYFGFKGGIVLRREKEVNGIVTSLKEDVKPLTYGFLLGTRFDFSKHVFFTIRWDVEINSMKKQQEEDDNFTNSLSLGFGVKF